MKSVDTLVHYTLSYRTPYFVVYNYINYKTQIIQKFLEEKSARQYRKSPSIGIIHYN